MPQPDVTAAKEGQGRYGVRYSSRNPFRRLVYCPLAEELTPIPDLDAANRGSGSRPMKNAIQLRWILAVALRQNVVAEFRPRLPGLKMRARESARMRPLQDFGPLVR